MAKAGLPVSQSPEGASTRPPEKTPETGVTSCTDMKIGSVQPPGCGAIPNEGIQGDE
jgi:hypothetical protein